MIHKYELNGYKIALDTCSGAVYSLDELTYDMLEYFEDDVTEVIDSAIINNFKNKYRENDIREAYNEIYNAFINGKIFSKDKYKEISNSDLLNSPIKAMCINVAHDCNMVCEYCFASKGDFGCGRELMTVETAKKAIDFLIENSKDRKNLEVEFFGGEPLIAFNTVKKTVEYARGLEKKYNKIFRFTITTNGILLTDDKIDFINEEMSTVVLSLDGRKEINDKMRKTKGGKGTYDQIIPKFKRLVERRNGKNYYIRGTFTRNNLDFAKDVMHIYNLGFDEISIEPVVGDKKLDYTINQEELKKVLDEYETLAKQIYKMKVDGSNINFYRFNVDLKNSPCAIKRLKGCSCGNEFIAVVPNGDIFPCHQFVGDDNFIMGNLNSSTFNNDMKELFSKTNMYKKDKCSECWARLYCGGGCNANNFHYMGDIRKTHSLSCEIEKKRIECALMLNVAFDN